MRILQEEKAYWAAQCLEAREQAERANAVADTNKALYEGEKKVRQELEERFELLFELMGIMQRTGYTTSVALNRITAEGLREHCKRAEEYVRPKGRQSKIDRKDLVLVAWRNPTNGSYYSDCRPLGPADTARVRRVLNSKEKIALYALDPQNDGE
ncbi:DNA ligase [Escherichia phage McMelon]